MKRAANEELERKTNDKKPKLNFNPQQETLKSLQDRARHLGFSYWPSHWKKAEFALFWDYVLAMKETENAGDLIHDATVPSADVGLCNPYTKPGGVMYFGETATVFVKDDAAQDVPHDLLVHDGKDANGAELHRLDLRIIPRHVRFCLERDYYVDGSYTANKPDDYRCFTVPHGAGKIVRGKKREGTVVWEGQWKLGKKVESESEEKEEGNKKETKDDSTGAASTTAV